MHIVIHINFRREYSNYEPLPLSQWDLLKEDMLHGRRSGFDGAIRLRKSRWYCYCLHIHGGFQ